MVRCYKALSNPPPSCYNLRKVKIHVRRLRSGNGGSSSCAGDQHPQLESPGPAGSAGGTPNRRTRFRYCSVFSALQEWWLKGETREGGWEGFWAEGATAICEAFVWPNYYKAPYALNWQRRACCYMTRGMRRLSFLSFLLSITRRMEKLARDHSETRPRQWEARGLRRELPGCSSAGIGPWATAVKRGRAVGGGAGPPRSMLATQLPAPPALEQTAGWWVVRMGGRMWSVPYSHAEAIPPPAGKKAGFTSAETALHLLSGFFGFGFFPLHCDAQIILWFLFISSWGEKELCSLQKRIWAKGTILHPKVMTVVPACMVF